MAAENPIWGAPRIHGELLKVGFHLSEPTVSRWPRQALRAPDLPVTQEAAGSSPVAPAILCFRVPFHCATEFLSGSYSLLLRLFRPTEPALQNRSAASARISKTIGRAFPDHLRGEDAPIRIDAREDNLGLATFSANPRDGRIARIKYRNCDLAEHASVLTGQIESGGFLERCSAIRRVGNLHGGSIFLAREPDYNNVLFVSRKGRR